ncbi:MAG: putative selenium-dependent hydroxylase accessory protein YqeC [Gracilibacteraceae bacterium]|jgi:probable selenium-dependent hydroxylase accessory protein YqeC|nr:putative selenium-dependent hydroxylase accessory protein YqeC [Gracilibacteraceae bacterium]
MMQTKQNGHNLRVAVNIGAEQVVSFVGGGGKTTAMFYLANELAQLGAKVIVTTTTKIFVPSSEEIGCLVTGTLLPEVVSAIQNCFCSHRIVGLGSKADDNNKLHGIPAHWPEILVATADYVLVEADGAKGKPLKAPAAHEPVLPTGGHRLVVVAGIDAVGERLSPAIAHRIEQIEVITGLKAGEVIKPGDIAAVVLHPQGLAKGKSLAETSLLINKIDNAVHLSAAREIARLVLAGGIPRVVIARLQGEPAIIETHGRK